MGYNVKIDGVEYYQPDCNCKGAGHICYLRPVPNVINAPIEKVLKALSTGAGTEGED